MTLLILYLALAIGVSFLCSILEAVLLSITPSYVENIEKEGTTTAGKQLAKVKDRIEHSLSSILILNTFAHTMGAAGVGSQALQIFGAEWETLIAVMLTLAILYFSEIIPKTLGASYWRQLAIPSAYIISYLVKLVYPLVWLSSHLTQLFNRKDKDAISREEIIAMASLSHKSGSLHPQENKYLSNLLSLREITTEEILTPRSVVYMLPESTTVSNALDEEDMKHFTRIPVYGENSDDIKGMVIRVDLFEAERQGKGKEAISGVINPIHRVSEKLPVQQLLDLSIKQKAHLFLVEDEFGQTAGVVSLEDAIETLLGREIVDESDVVEDMQDLAKIKYRDRKRILRRSDKEESQKLN